MREALDMVPTADIDLSDYSDRLWRNAYERGKAVSKDALDEAYAHGYTAAEADFHKKNQWIPVTERLPEIGEKVLVSTKYTVFTQVFKRIYGTPDRWGWEHNTIKKVTAWMPLPECYRGEKDGE